jgi:hypothetical protein
LLGRARRAGVLAIIVGCLTMLCDGALIFQFIRNPESLFRMEGMSGMPGGGPVPDPEMVRGVVGVFLWAIEFCGLLMIVMGALTFRGSKAAAITNIVLATLGALWLLCNGVAAVPMLSAAPGLMAVTLLIVAVPLVLLVWLIVWNAQAATAAGQYKMMTAYAQQYQQMQQGYGGAYGHQGYGQAGYGQPGHGGQGFGGYGSQASWPQQQQQQWQQPAAPQQWPPSQPNQSNQSNQPPPQSPPPPSPPEGTSST